MRNISKKKLILVILGIIFGFSIIANSNINYYQGGNYGNLEDDTTDNNSQENKILKSSNGGINLITPEDKVYYKPMSGYYPGTNSFDHDEVGTEPTWFQEVGTNGGTVQVIDVLDGHNSVLELHDTNVTDAAYVQKNLLLLPSKGTIEFWMRTDNTSKACGFYLWGGILAPEIIISVRTWSNTIQYWNGANWIEIENITVQNDEWFHVRIDFECSNGGYQGLAQYTWQIFINGGLSQVFLFNVDKINVISIVWFTDLFMPFSDHYLYIDAIAFSWVDGCNIADNMNDGLLLKFQAPSNLTWIGYSLDGHNNITVLGETAIPKPGNGPHSIKVFGKDSGNAVYTSELRNFEVNNPTLVLIPGISGDSEPLLNGITSSMLDLNNNGISDFIDYYGSQNIFNVSYYDRYTNRTEFDGIDGAGSTSLQIIGNAVKNYIINEFNAGNIKKNIDLIAWSQGGLVIRTMIKEHYNDLRKAGITIIHASIYGSPHHGQWAFNAIYWNYENNGTLTEEIKNTCPLQMYTFSEFLMDLNFGDETRYDIYYNTYRGTGILDVSYWGLIFPNLGDYNLTLVIQIRNLIGTFGDGFVATGSAVLSGAVNNRAYRLVGHSGIVNYPEVQKDILWDLKCYPGLEIDIKSPKNQTYYEPMDGHYPGTNSFDHDEVGSEPTWFQEVGTNGGTVQVIENLDGHNSVLELHDTSSGSVSAHVIKNLFGTPEFGSVEYWMRSDNPKLCGVRLDNGAIANELVTMRIEFNVLQYYNGSDWNNVRFIENNTWYHIRVDFECSTGNYTGLSQYTWRLYVNSINYGEFNFINNQSQASRIEWYTDFLFGLQGYSYYIDAIGFSWTSFIYNLGDNLYEGLLLSFNIRLGIDLNLIEYSLDNQNSIKLLGNTTIPLPDDGFHEIQVFGNDLSGIMRTSEGRYFTIDTSPPEITINSPNQNDLFGITAPSFELSIFDPNLDDTWYTLDDGITNITFPGLTLTINKGEWDKKGNGTVSIRFYANDAWGHEGFLEIILRKDAYIPDITINSPLSNEKFGRNPPEFNISIFEEDLVSSWYTIEGIEGNFYFTEFDGTFDKDAWDELSEGVIIITFYALDRAGNEGVESVYILKSLPSSQAVSGYNLLFLLSILSVISIIIIAKIRKFRK